MTPSLVGNDLPEPLFKKYPSHRDFKLLTVWIKSVCSGLHFILVLL